MGDPKSELTGAQNVLTCTSLRQDYMTVVAKEPIRKGRHYFQFIMHNVEDEEWCGVTPLPEQAKANPHPNHLKGWLYYCGRMRPGNIRAKGGLMFMEEDDDTPGELVIKRYPADGIVPQGDVIGMAIDLDLGRIVFDL